MSVQGSLKWLALAGVGVLISGCVAAPASNVGYSETPPGTFVADPSYPGGGYYEVIEAYEQPSYYYGSRPYYGSFGTSLYWHSHGGHRHRHVGGHRPHGKHDDAKPKKRKKPGKKPEKRAEKKDLTDEQRAAREERRAERRAACVEAGYPNCRAQRRAEKRAAKAEEATTKKDIQPATKRKRKRKKPVE